MKPNNMKTSTILNMGASVFVAQVIVSLLLCLLPVLQRHLSSSQKYFTNIIKYKLLMRNNVKLAYNK